MDWTTSKLLDELGPRTERKKNDIAQEMGCHLLPFHPRMKKTRPATRVSEGEYTPPSHCTGKRMNFE
ncbi:hypothetical protein I7I53_02074 [Histoplasma capsulatum var. duboisii H88]|uniref:Uncharacterized protein n=1 Tax=Ajellomyces capsulatus (strain H88) TaxID=544711 RepID=A0A8A1LKQ2_AJEC8|nr:hypothetical protein I7I53_02074 [Histoplasma capsulatum var. duboisii H88]